MILFGNWLSNFVENVYTFVNTFGYSAPVELHLSTKMTLQPTVKTEVIHLRNDNSIWADFVKKKMFAFLGLTSVQIFCTPTQTFPHTEERHTVMI